MVKHVRIYSVDALGCYKDVPVVGGTVDANVDAPTVKDNTTGVGSGPGDILPPGADDVTPDPGGDGDAFAGCGQFVIDAWCYISGLPGWLFVPSDETMTAMETAGEEFQTKAPIGWIVLGKNLADRVNAGSFATTEGEECSPFGGNAEVGSTGGCSALGIVRTGAVDGGTDHYVHYLGQQDAGSQVLKLFRPIATVVMLAMLYMGIGVWIGKMVLSKAVT